MIEQNLEDLGKQRSTMKRCLRSRKENMTQLLEEELTPIKRSKRGAKDNVKAESKDSPLCKALAEPSYSLSCSRCKELEAEVECLQNELNRIKDKENSVLQLSAAESIIHKVLALGSTVSALTTSKISALCALEMERKDPNSGVEIEVKDDKVNLGQNYYCSLANWQVMNRTDRMAEWYVAILHGTFGEDAKNYRVNPRSKEYKSFDPTFLNVAKGLFCKFLDRRISELKGKEDEFSAHLLNFFQSNRETLVRQLPANLSDRAYAMYRGKYSEKTKLSNAKSSKVAQARQKRPNSNMRPFCKMLTQPKPKKGFEFLYKKNASSEESEEEELKP